MITLSIVLFVLWGFIGFTWLDMELTDEKFRKKEPTIKSIILSGPVVWCFILITIINIKINEGGNE